MMVNFCAIIGCSNRGDRDIDKSFFRLPSIVNHQTYELTKRRQEAWLARVKRENLRPEKYPYTRVCSDHFVTGMPSELYDTTHPDWAPSQKLGYTPDLPQSVQERYERAAQRSAKKIELEDIADDPIHEDDDNEVFRKWHFNPSANRAN